MTNRRTCLVATLFLLRAASAQDARCDDFTKDALRRDPSAVAVLNFWLADHGLGDAARQELEGGIVTARDPEVIDAWTRVVMIEFAARLRAGVTEPFASAALAAGFELTFIGSLVPIVSVRGPIGIIVERLGGARAVLAIHLDRSGGAELENSVPTVRADWVRTLPVPITGAGVKVGIVDTGYVSTTNPNLPAGTISNTISGSVQAHATAVAGMVSSNHATLKGVAPGVTLVSSPFGTTESTLVANGEWAFQNGANVVNVSLVVPSDPTGSINLSDRGFDYLIRSLGKMLVKSCGNQGNANYVTSPGRGWNSIAVGNIDDRNTKDWSDDIMSTSSSGLDPQNGVPKPEVAAPGTNINSTTTASPWTGATGSGTSYAAPHCAGMLALLMEQDAALRAHPEALKALAIATAWHNIEGDPVLSNLDGAGGIDAAAAYQTVAAARYGHGILTLASFNAAGEKDFAVNLKAGNLTRAVVSWDSNAAAGPAYATDGLDAKFDVSILPPGGGPALATATHPAAAWRIIQFLPPVSGSYTLRLTRTQFNGTAEPYGYAVSQRYDDDTNRIFGVTDVVNGTTLAMTLSDPYHPSAAYIVGAGISGGAYDQGIALSERVLPLVPDGVTTLAFTPGNGIFSPMQGTLNASGQANLSISVPFFPALAGIQVSLCFVTLGLSGADGIVGVSPRYISTIL